MMGAATGAKARTISLRWRGAESAALPRLFSRLNVEFPFGWESSVDFLYTLQAERAAIRV